MILYLRKKAVKSGEILTEKRRYWETLWGQIFMVFNVLFVREKIINHGPWKIVNTNSSMFKFCRIYSRKVNTNIFSENFKPGKTLK